MAYEDGRGGFLLMTVMIALHARMESWFGDGGSNLAKSSSDQVYGPVKLRSAVA